MLKKSIVNSYSGITDSYTSILFSILKSITWMFFGKKNLISFTEGLPCNTGEKPTAPEVLTGIEALFNGPL